MRKTDYLIWTAPLIIAILAGCNTVHFQHPIGEPIAAESAEVSENLDGTWANEDGETVQLKYLGGGKLRVAGLDWDEDEQTFQKNEMTVLLTTHRSIEYINFTDEKADDGKYVFARYVLASDHTMICWTPRPEAFEKAVKAGKLEGTVKRENHSTTVEITAAKEQVDQFIDPDRFTEQFETKTPVVFRRLRR